MRFILLYSSPVVPHPHFLLLAMVVMVIAFFLVTAFILFYLVQKKKKEKRMDVWRDQLSDALQRVIYFEPAEDQPPAMALTFKTMRELVHPEFRQLLIDELIQAKKALTGTAAINLIALFNQLHLDQLSLKKLNSRKWHLKARGIQELAMMEQRLRVKRIYRLTNADNDMVRMEAQSAIVQLYGFEGLRFLDIIDRPLSEWQQIKLLRLLARAPGILPDKVGSWLVSANDSVRIFSLKLVAEHHQQELHDQVVNCLYHRNPQVRLQAVRCLREIFTEDTCVALFGIYGIETIPCRLAILDTLGQIGSESDCLFLTSRLEHDDNHLRLGAARALVKLGGPGLQCLDQFPKAAIHPWKVIIGQAKTEWTA